MKLLFIADPLDQFKIVKDSTFAMMREAASRGDTLWAAEPRHLAWRSGDRVTVRCRRITLTGQAEPWYEAAPDEVLALADFSAVLMRKDPPFDSEYFYATHLLEQAEREGGCVVNSARSLRDHSEKLAVMEFPGHVPPTLVTRDAQQIREFHAQHRDIILKPLDGMGGLGIFRVGPDGLNLGSIIETLNGQGETTVMAQRYIPEITQGDKRVLIIDGEPVPFVLARIPQGSEIRGNLAAGGKGVAQPLNERDRATALEIGRRLAPRGLLLIGLDVIGDRVTEINVTSPTCFQEIMQQTGFDVARVFIDALHRRIAAG